VEVGAETVVPVRGVEAVEFEFLREIGAGMIIWMLLLLLLLLLPLLPLFPLLLR
jgi:hypothetical protein